MNDQIINKEINPYQTTSTNNNISNESSFVGPMNRTVWGEFNGPVMPNTPNPNEVYDNGTDWGLPNPYNRISPLLRGFGNTRSGRTYYGR